jgi:hypothetical protein
MFIYYNIAGGWHCGAIGINEHLQNADSLSSKELDDLGWVKADIPDSWLNIYTQYKEGQLLTQDTPFPQPPFWEELSVGLITNSLFQRVRKLKKTSLAISSSFDDIFQVIAGSKNEQALAWTVFELQQTLLEGNDPITPEEIAETESLLTSLGFHPNFFTYAAQLVTAATQGI